MISLSKWKRTFRQTSTFQIILCVILFHSLASIFIIYIHLTWFFNDEENIWKQSDSTSDEISIKDKITWNMHSAINILSSKIISSDEITLFGWWMDHARWESDIKCINQRRILCSKSFSTTCKTDGIRAIYQYINFPKVEYVTGLEISVTATADQLEPQAVGASFGALALIKLHDGETEIIQVQFPPNIEPLTRRSVSFSSSKSYVNSVTVMLMCYGYTGSVFFTEPSLVPQVTSYNVARNVIGHCPIKSFKPQPPVAINKLENIFRGNKSGKEEFLVTLVTQVSMDRLSALERSLHVWDGPVSLVIYITSKHSEKSEYEWQRLYVQKKLKNINLSSSSHVILAFGNSVNGDYPINLLRNIAIKNVNTKYMFLLDADFQPSPDFQHTFATAVKQYNPKKKTVFVVPAFEYMELPQRNDNAPQTKEELLQLLHREEPFLLPFRITESSESHKITDYWKWYRSDKPYIINSFCDKYEPYIVLQKTDMLPLYDERFTGYGMNKVTYITELFAANYSFAVLPDVWVLHLPHKISTFAVEFLQNPHQRLQNRMKRFEFLADIMNIYKIGTCI